MRLRVFKMAKLKADYRQQRAGMLARIVQERAERSDGCGGALLWFDDGEMLVVPEPHFERITCPHPTINPLGTMARFLEGKGADAEVDAGGNCGACGEQVIQMVCLDNDRPCAVCGEVMRTGLVVAYNLTTLEFLHGRHLGERG